eukprot:GHVU01206519.1.p1 GENE.GHVU01206519.1~~GHVU01206519.1.p1  ORF type:complete len:617 (+),score=61.84 GHVU01206519.1:111-1853(+)
MTSTPASKVQTYSLMDGRHSPSKIQTYSLIDGRHSPIPRPTKRHNLSVGSDSAFYTEDGFSDHDMSREREKLSPIQNIMQYRSPSPVSEISELSRKSRESGGSRFDVDYGKFYKRSFLEAEQKDFKKGPSINPQTRITGKGSHFHRPENFSYYHVRKDFTMPMRKENEPENSSMSAGPVYMPSPVNRKPKRGSMLTMLGDSTVISKRKLDPAVPMNNREAIMLSKFPNAAVPDKEFQAPIDRDDWPAPPEPAAAFPELLREHPLGQRRKSTEELEAEEEKSFDPRIQKEIDELSKMPKCGVGKVIMRHLEKKGRVSPTLDPRSASRTPGADHEPAYKTRYESPLFASPSRLLDFRPRLRSMDDELLNKRYRTSTLPISNFPVDRRAYETPKGKTVVPRIAVAKPGYGLATKSRSLPVNRILAVDLERYEYMRDRNGERYRTTYSEDELETDHEHTDHEGDGRSYQSSHGWSPTEEYDPQTGLRRSRRRGSGQSSDFASESFLGFKRTMPSLFKAEEPPKIYDIEQLKITNVHLPPDVERNTVERHLSKDDFEGVFQMKREDFYRLAEWKRNDMKRRIDLF